MFRVYECFVSLFLVVSTSVIDCLEKLVSEMTYYVSSGTLNPTHLLMLNDKFQISSILVMSHVIA